MNVTLMREIQLYIWENYSRMDMRVGLSDCGDCEHCIGGVAVLTGTRKTISQLLSEGYPRWHANDTVLCWLTVQGDARLHLGLTGIEASRLFYVHNWPDKFKLLHQGYRPGSIEYAKILLQRIDWFIETKGTDVQEKPFEKTLEADMEEWLAAR